MAKRVQKKRDRRGPSKGQPITTDVLQKHADALARVWLELKKEKPELTSSEFWKLLKKRWTVEELEEALSGSEGCNQLQVYSELFSESTQRLPNGFWDDWSNVETALKPICTALGRFPTGQELRDRGLWSLVISICGKHGGMHACAERLGYAPSRAKPGDWMDEALVVAKLKEITNQLGRFPGTKDLRSLGLSGFAASLKRFGGVNALREKLGKPIKKRSTGHWSDWSNLELEIRDAAEKLGHFPSQKELAKLGLAYLTRGIKHHGGATVVRRRMGYDLAKKPAGYWENPENLKSELIRAIGMLGSFPTQKQLTAMGLTSICFAATRYHGGLRKLKVEMGYGPVTQEMLVANADQLALVYIALKKRRVDVTSDRLWKAIKSRWCEKDLQAAIEAFKKRKSLTAFKKLLA